MRDSDLEFVIDRLYKVEEANKGLTTRIRLLEAEADRFNMYMALDKLSEQLSKEISKESLEGGNT